MRSKSMWASFLAVSIGSSASAPVQAAPPSPAPDAEPTAAPGDHGKAYELFLKGKALFAQGKIEEAYEVYKAAWELKKGYDIAGNLGNAAFQLGKMRDAAEYLSYCRRSFPVTGSAAQLAKVEERLAQARKKVGALRIKVSVGGADVLVDGVLVGRSPLEDEIFIEPGAHSIKATLPGYRDASAEIRVVDGGTESLALALLAAPDEKEPAPAPIPKSVALIAAGAGLAVAGIAAGFGFTLASNSKSDESLQMWLDLGDTGGRGACLKAAFQKDCDVFLATYKDSQIFRGVAIGGYVAGGVFAVATMVYALGPWPSRSGSSKGSGSPSVPAPEVRAAFGVVPGGGGATLVGTF